MHVGYQELVNEDDSLRFFFLAALKCVQKLFLLPEHNPSSKT
ncbi:hypothetical protein XBI1_3010064 [Xenorhabdus bovienii str. Intermedium]|uniref:Uncharacterized protein n=1 Tax=Xenorhabdus bovienii str. Intermedium TaxID=1379677 RepID=A0A077QLR3_XENBV|nr:hypothetical protein XBI1_3010064 [Xenorhabdus bovienii str. Intermedium]